MTLPNLLMVASVLLVGFSAAGILVLYADQRARRLRDRRSKIVTPYQRSEAPVIGIARLSVAVPTAALVRRMKMFIGMDPDRRDPYRFKPIVVMPLALLPGWAMQWLLHGLLGKFAWAFLPLAAWFVTRSIYIGSDTKRTATLYRQFPDALATIVRGVRVGIPVSEALRAVAQDSEMPTSIEFGRLYDQVSIGTPIEDALREMASRNRLPEYRFFATALALQSQTGGGLTETLENLADVIRKRVALKARGYALAAEARTSAGVLTVLPVFAAAALAVMSPDYIAELMQEGTGQTVFGCSVLWLGTGMMVMRYMIKKSLA